MTTTKLSIYNGALLEIGERELASLSENREPRRLLDRVWDNGALDFCLNAGQWRFARRSVELSRDTDISPSFGYQYGFSIPSDFIRTCAVCSDQYFNVPLLQYSQEQRYWFADIDPLYVSYVSNGASYGGDLTIWPMEFVRYVEAYLAGMIANKLTQNREEWTRLHKLAKLRLTEAKSGNAMEGPTALLPVGSWVAARAGRGGSRLDRGSRSALTG